MLIILKRYFKQHTNRYIKMPLSSTIKFHFCDDHREKNKIIIDINKINSYNNRIKIPLSIVEDNFKKLLWEKKFSVIYNEINFENFLKTTIQDQNETFIQNKSFIDINFEGEFIKKLFKTKVLFSLLIKMNNKNYSYLAHKMLNKSFIDIINFLIDPKNYLYSELYPERKDFFHEIILFFIECNSYHKNHLLLLNEKDINNLFRNNEMTDLPDKQNKSSLSIDQEIFIEDPKDKEENKKKRKKKKENLFEKECKIYQMTITELIYLLIYTNKINFQKLIENLFEKKNNIVLFYSCDVISKYKILNFLLDLYENHYKTMYLFNKNKSKENNNMKNIRKRIDKDQVEDLSRKSKYIDVENLLAEKEEIFKKIKSINSSIIESKKEFLSKACEELIQLSFVYAEKEKLYFYNINLISSLLNTQVYLSSHNELINSIFINFIQNLNLNENLTKIDQDIDFESEYIYKFYLSLFKIFKMLFDNIEKSERKSTEINSKNIKEKQLSFDSLVVIYLETFENFCMNMTKKILIKKLFLKNQIIFTYKIQRINNFILFNYILQEDNLKKYEFRLPIILSYSLKNSLKKLFNRAYSEIHLEEFKLYIFQMYLFNKYLNKKQIQYFYNHENKKKEEPEYYKDYIQTLIDTINQLLFYFRYY